MTTIFDYLRWRGDLSFSQSPLNPVDALIFSVLAYLPFDGLVDSGSKRADADLSEIAREFQRREVPKDKIRSVMDLELLRVCGLSRRFGQTVPFAYVNRTDLAEEKQFSAISFRFGKKSVFAAFRGTDLSLVGWKEDFNMSFMCPVPAQTEALSYLERVASSYRGPLYVGGHSKGGNLAVYSSAFAHPRIQKRIHSVYNNDGPGFDASVLSSPGFKRLENRLFAFVPESSIIGMLLEHQEEYTIVSSSVSGILQHDPYSWSVEGPDFVRVDTVDDSSRFIDRTIRDWLAAVDPEKRELFIDSLWEIVTVTKAHTLRDFASDWLKHTRTMIRTFKNVDPETRSMLVDTAGLLFKTATRNLVAKEPERKKRS
ncbi:DUF2974 domain-containing protein [Treponema zuelzerae]|uniref:DUF2974 domain-containing protein n=1 Tax=Teretinema zuelzerae TaxID=156 RepID=A0AAE3EJK5_9SPIR|nr:DUF2974 domain-containing protein [Teretinema zuelzerae]MCD1654996.1 DUF2974 domain-containing protein [Teretinema zuelzerae]